jgi:cellulose synthase/poly-beta-1,6-N-acetylglucosamine synthase-like glycosyltransferase
VIAALVIAGLALMIFWVLAGYPLWLRQRARRRPRPVQRDQQERSVSVIIAVRNGERYLRAKLQSVLAQDYPADKVEILVVSDGSTDATEAIARQFAPRVRLLVQLPSGKGAALNLAIPQATGEILVLTDVRQQLAPDCIRRLVACFGDPRVGAVSGELRIRNPETAEEISIGLYWRYESAIRRWLSACDSMLGATGPIYAMRRELATPLPPGILLDDMYLPLQAFFRGYRLVQEEAAIAWDYPTALDTEFRRKVRTLGGNYQLLYLMPQLLSPANRLWLDYVSYKLGRLLLPVALAGIFAASWFLPPPWRTALLAGQAAFYGLALVDLALPQGAPGKRLTSAVRTFVVLMAASACALSVLLVPPQRLWKVTQTPVRS